MNKLIVVSAAILLIGGGCSLIDNFSAKKVEVKSNIPDVHYLESELFSLETPVMYQETIATDGGGGGLVATHNPEYPEIIFGIADTKNELSRVELVALEKELISNMCGQTGACGQPDEFQDVSLDGKNGIRFVVRISGRGLGDTDGYIEEYHYSFAVGKKLFKFWASASDLEDPEQREAMFDDIMKTIQFE